MMRAPFHRFWDGALGRRATAAGLTFLVHLLVLILALSSFGGAKTIEQPALATFAIELPGPPDPDPPQAPQPIKVPPQPAEPIIVPPVEIQLPTDNPLIVALLAQANENASGGGCDLTAPVEAALQSDTNVAETLPSIARDRRSVANALAVWNQRWIKADEKFPEKALDAIRETVRLTVVAASDACRAQTQNGPRLVYLVGQDQTTVLALGSGEWTWQQVADSADPQFLLQEATLASGNSFPRPVDDGKEKTLLDRILGR